MDKKTLQVKRIKVKLAREILEAAEGELLDVELALVAEKLSAREGPEDPPDASDLEVGSSKCTPSPIDVCVYDVIEDPCRDFCLFCGEPAERK